MTQPKPESDELGVCDLKKEAHVKSFHCTNWQSISRLQREPAPELICEHQKHEGDPCDICHPPADPPSSVGAPAVEPRERFTQRGFENFCEFRDTYGSNIVVRESSGASEHCVWIFAQDNPHMKEPSPHFNAEQALIVAEALTRFASPSAPVEDQGGREERLLNEAMSSAAKSRCEIPASSYIRKDIERLNAYETGFIIGHRQAARAASLAPAQESHELEVLVKILAQLDAANVPIFVPHGDGKHSLTAELTAHNETKRRLEEAEKDQVKYLADHGKTLLLLNKAAFETIPALEAERDHWKGLAEKAVEVLKTVKAGDWGVPTREAIAILTQEQK